MEMLREIFWLSVLYNVYLTARYLEGKQNVIADTLSQVNEVGIVNTLNRFALCCSG